MVGSVFSVGFFPASESGILYTIWSADSPYQPRLPLMSNLPIDMVMNSIWLWDVLLKIRLAGQESNTGYLVTGLPRS